MSSALKPNPFSDRSQARSTAPCLEVLADREVAEHLEEREVPRGVADVLDVGRAKALLAARQQRRGRRLEAQEVALERVHSRRREQHRLVEGRRNQRCGRQALVAALLEEPQEGLTDLVRGRAHGAIVAQPTTTSPRSSTAVWPGATPQTGSASVSSSPSRTAATGVGAVAELRRVDLRLGPVQRDRAERHARAAQRLAGADGDRVRLDVGGGDVERLAAAAAGPHPAPLADGVRVRAAVAGDGAPGEIERAPGALARAAVALEERLTAGAGEEAEVLRVGRARDRQPLALGQLAHLRLGQLAEREAQSARCSRARARRACTPGPWRGSAAARISPSAVTRA